MSRRLGSNGGGGGGGGAIYAKTSVTTKIDLLISYEDIS
jgi:hypothetical protein